MKKFTVIILGCLFFLITACNSAPGETEAAIELPTLVPTAVVIENSNTNAVNAETNTTETTNVTTESEENVETAVTAEESAPAVMEDSSDTSTTNETTDNNDSGPINLDDVLLYNEPQDTDYFTTLEFQMTVNNADGTTTEIGRVFAEGSRTVEPDAKIMTFTMEGAAGGNEMGDTITIAQIENAFYALTEFNGCINMTGQSGFENPFDLFLDTGGFLAEDVQRVMPNQIVNGIDSQHYLLNQENLVDMEIYEIYNADLFVAEDGGFVTQLQITGYGINDLIGGNNAQEGDVYYELNFTPSNDVPTIVPPPECGQTNEIATDYPTLPDATGILSTEGVYAYETQTPFAEVVEFYKTEMTKDNEWTLIQEIIQEPNANLTFSGAGGTVMVGIGPGQNGGTQIGIIPTP